MLRTLLLLVLVCAVPAYSDVVTKTIDSFDDMKELSILARTQNVRGLVVGTIDFGTNGIYIPASSTTFELIGVEGTNPTIQSQLHWPTQMPYKRRNHLFLPNGKKANERALNLIQLSNRTILIRGITFQNFEWPGSVIKWQKPGDSDDPRRHMRIEGCTFRNIGQEYYPNPSRDENGNVPNGSYTVTNQILSAMKMDSLGTTIFLIDNKFENCILSSSAWSHITYIDAWMIVARGNTLFNCGNFLGVGRAQPRPTRVIAENNVVREQGWSRDRRGNLIRPDVFQIKSGCDFVGRWNTFIGEFNYIYRIYGPGTGNIYNSPARDINDNDYSQATGGKYFSLDSERSQEPGGQPIDAYRTWDLWVQSGFDTNSLPPADK